MHSPRHGILLHGALAILPVRLCTRGYLLRASHPAAHSLAGASEPRNLGYMVRLGLWGTGNTAFADFASFLQAISQRGVAALELVAMDLKAQGVYVARTLSFAGAWRSIVSLRMTPVQAETATS